MLESLMKSEITSYADETGHGDDPSQKHMGIAGLVAQSRAWEKFDSEWRQICSEEGVEMPFHMMDFAAFSKQFASLEWKEEAKRRRLLGRFLNAIEQSEAIPIGVIVSLDDFNSLSKPQRVRLGGPQANPYYRAFQTLTRYVEIAGALSVPPSPVSMIFARLPGFVGRSGGLWDVIKKYNPHLRFWMGSFTTGEPKDYTPLQAADLWAYELGHHFRTIFPKGMEWRYPFSVRCAAALRLRGQHAFRFIDVATVPQKHSVALLHLLSRDRRRPAPPQTLESSFGQLLTIHNAISDDSVSFDLRWHGSLGCGVVPWCFGCDLLVCAASRRFLSQRSPGPCSRQCDVSGGWWLHHSRRRIRPEGAESLDSILATAATFP